MPAENDGRPVGVAFFPWLCPLCGGSGRWESGERCMQCTGYGLAGDDVWREWSGVDVDGAPMRPAPVPPAVMRSPCRDCAFRPHSPEQESQQVAVVVTGGEPFYCHHGLHHTGSGYSPPAVEGPRPVGAMVCAGWWAAAQGHPYPQGQYRDPPDTHPYR